MKTLLTRLRDEPVLLTTLVQATLTLLVTFGLNLSTAQNIAILGVTTALLAMFARSKVTPTKALEELAQAQETVDAAAGVVNDEPEPIEDQVEGVEDEDTLDGHVPQV